VPRLLWVLMFAGCAAGAARPAAGSSLIAPAPADTSLSGPPVEVPLPGWTTSAAWRFELRAEQVYVHTHDETGPRASSGTGVSLEALHPLRPWFAIGAEFGGYWFDAAGLALSRGFDASPPSQAITLGVTYRFTVPARAGISPYLAARSGAIALHRNAYIDVTRFGDGFGSSAGWFEVDACSSVGVGLRSAWSRPWPGFDASWRLTTLMGSTPANFMSPGLAITW